MSDTLSLVKRIREWSAAKGYTMSEEAAVEAINQIRREGAIAMRKQCAEIAAEHERYIIASKETSDVAKIAAEIAGLIYREILTMPPLNAEPKR